MYIYGCGICALYNMSMLLVSPMYRLNDATVADQSCPSAFRQEIIVVDDGSEPPLEELFKKDAKRLDQETWRGSELSQVAFWLKICTELPLSNDLSTFANVGAQSTGRGPVFNTLGV